MNKTPLIIILALLLVSMAHAELIVNKYTSDFTLSSPYNEQIKMCSCETKVDHLLVDSVGNFDAQFTVKLITDYPGKIHVSEDSFSLAPKHQKELLVYIEDSCGFTGTYSYDVVVRSNYGRVEQLSRTINTAVCENTNMEVTPASQSTGLCAPAEFNVKVTNVGTYPEQYTLNFGQYDNIANVSTRSLYLQPGENFEQNVGFTWACNEYGTFTVPFTAQSRTGPSAYAERQVTVENQYDFGMGLDTEAHVCGLVQSSIPISVKNNAPVPDVITLHAKAPSHVNLDTSALHLTAGEEKNASLIVNAETKIGKYTISIDANDAYGGIDKQRDFTLAVDNCYDETIELRSDAVTPVDTFVGCCGDHQFFVNVLNNGDREQVFQLELDGPSFFQLEETSVRVQPSENVNVPIDANLPCTDQSYDLTVKSYPVGHPELTVTSTMTVESQTQRTCHMVQIDDDEVSLRETDTVLPVIVKNTGIEGGNYTVNLDSDLFTPLESSMYFAPGEQKVLHLQPKVNLSTQEKGRYVLEPILSLAGIDYNEHLGIELKPKSLWQKFKDWFLGLPWNDITICGWVVFAFTLILVGLIIYLLLVYTGVAGFFSNGLPKSTLGVMKAIVVGIIVLLLLFLLFVPGPSQTSAQEKFAGSENAVVLEWNQNENMQLDLNQYFSDPDKDTLTYTASQPRDIAVNIEGNILTLTPDHNFAGENTMVVTADDGKNGVVDSPIFLLRVKAIQHLTFLEWIEMWCAQLRLSLMTAIFVVLLLLLLTVKEDKPRDPKGNVIVVVPKSKQRVKKASTRSAAAHRRRHYFYASKTGTKAHKHGCMALDNVRKKDLVTYKSEAAVLKAGLALCSICYDVASKNPTARMKHRHTTEKKSSKKISTRKSSSKEIVPAKSVPVKAVKGVPVKDKKSGKDKSQTVNIQVNIANK